MERPGYFYFGRVIKTKGIRGMVTIYMDVDDPDRYEGMDALFIERKKDLIPLLIEKLESSGNKATVKFEGIDSLEEAEKITACSIFLPIDLLPPLKGNQFYYHEVEGFEIIDQVRGSVGVIKEILDIPNNPLFVILKGEKEILLPVKDEVIIKIDRKKKEFHVKAPEGLIDIYLED